MSSSPRTGPAPFTLALLGLAVLAAHVGLLAGEVDLSSPRPADPPVADAATAPVAPEIRPVWVTQAQVAAPAPAPVARPARPLQVAAAPAPARTARAEAPVAAPATATPVAVDTLAQAKPAAAPGPAAASALPPSTPPPSATLPYEVLGQAKGFSYNATGSLVWKLDGQNYEASMELSMPLVGKRTQTSRGSVGPEGLRPERFADKRSSEKAAHFERAAQRIRFSSNAPEAQLLPGAQDRLSLFMQLAGMMRARPLAEGSSVAFQVAGTGDAELWHFDIGPMEKLDLPAGAIEARKVTRAPRKEHDSTVEIWLAPSLNHLPVRLRIAQANGDVADQRLARRP